MITGEDIRSDDIISHQDLIKYRKFSEPVNTIIFT